MERVGQTAPLLKKGKKKHAKDELDRQKQAEKKRRRLEKALATSAAIRSELEKKKQKKKEEQQRLDEEGAAIAEAVALHVLVGEDAEEPHCFMLKNDSRFNPWDNYDNFGLVMGYQHFGKYSAGANTSDCRWNELEGGQTLPQGVHVRDIQSPFHVEDFQGADISAELMAAQAVAALQIGEDSCPGAATFIIDRMLAGGNVGDAVNLYNEF